MRLRLSRGKAILLGAFIVILAILAASIPYISSLATYLTHLQTPYFVYVGAYTHGITLQNLGATAQNVRVEWTATVNGTVQNFSWPLGAKNTFQKFWFSLWPYPDEAVVLVRWDGGEQTVTFERFWGT